VYDATPDASVTTPSDVAPSLNVTVPVGVPAVADAIVAVSTTEPFVATLVGFAVSALVVGTRVLGAEP
jgi:hypothetical protein